MNRQEHLDWAKQRALEFVDSGDLVGAIKSIASDLQKHLELRNHQVIELTTRLVMSGQINTPEALRSHIEEFE